MTVPASTAAHRTRRHRLVRGATIGVAVFVLLAGVVRLAGFRPFVLLGVVLEAVAVVAPVWLGIGAAVGAVLVLLTRTAARVADLSRRVSELERQPDPRVRGLGDPVER